MMMAEGGGGQWNKTVIKILSAERDSEEQLF